MVAIILVLLGKLGYPAWRTRVLEIYNHTCVICDYAHKENGDISVHHLDGFSWCVERRTDISNGVVLCSHDCHYEFHRIYGRGKNAEEQFKEFYLNKTGESFKQE